MTAHEVSVPRPFRLSLTLRQMMKIVVFAAVASACLAAGVQHAQMVPQAWYGVVMTEAVVIPLALAVTALPLVRFGPQKDWLIRALVMTALAMAWADAFIYLVRAILLLTRGRYFSGFSWIETVATVAILPVPLVWLFWTCLPGKCPDCRRLTLIRYSSGHLLSGLTVCMRCSGRYKKRDGNWEPLTRT